MHTLEQANSSIEFQSEVGNLFRSGWDLYDVMRSMLSRGLESISIEDISYLQDLIPRCRNLKTLDTNDIHGMIARWTSSKYHTASIQEVVLDIQQKCAEKQIGIFIYNSNLNPRNKNAANDPYVLMVTEQQVSFHDLNRKISYRYSFESEDTLDDSDRDL